MPKLNFTGTGAAYYPKLGNTSAWFRINETLYLLDCGATVFERLAGGNAFAGVRRITVFITHLHADHSGSLGLLLCYGHDVLGIVSRVVCPLEEMGEFLRLSGVEPDAYEWQREMEAPDGNGVSVKFIPVQHVEEIPANGLLLCDGKEIIYYSGDAASVPEPVLADFQRGNIRRIYQDTALGDTQSHCTLEHLKQDIGPGDRERVFCMHLDSSCEETLRAAGFRVAEQSK